MLRSSMNGIVTQNDRKPFMKLNGEKPQNEAFVTQGHRGLRDHPQPATALEQDHIASAVVRTARDPLLILNARLEIEIANEAFFSTFRIKPADAIGRSVFTLDRCTFETPKLRQLLEDILP